MSVLPQVLPLWETAPGKGLQVYEQEITPQPAMANYPVWIHK